MSLEFKEFEGKISKNNFLKLNFSINKGESLSIISDEDEPLKIIKKVFLKKFKYSGNAYYNGNEIKKHKDGDILFSDHIGFYDGINISKNLKYLTRLFGITYSDKEIVSFLEKLNLKPDSRYKTLSESEAEKLKILFLVLIAKDIIIIENVDKKLTEDDAVLVREFLEDTSDEGITIIIIDKTLNELSEYSNLTLVISNGEQSYFGKLSDLKVIKQLAVITFEEEIMDLEDILFDIEYTKFADKEIIVREELLEEIIYTLVSNNIEIENIRNFGEKIKLYMEENI